MPDETLTPRQVAEELGVTVRTVQRWVAEGRLPADRVGGRVRVSRSSLGNVTEARTTPLARPIQALLIANRGEIAVRVAATARQLGMRTIGVHAPDDRPPDGLDLALPIPGYLDGDAIIDAARRSGADAIHPGYGFLAENADFAAAVERAGLTWVGPPAAAIAAMGDKAAARRTAAAHGVPVTPGYDGEAQDDTTLAGEAVRIGLPILVKPSAGGGGKGMRVVHEAFRLPDELAAARREAQRAFGDDRLILERLLVGARHVEVQVLFDRHGHGVHLGERDCSTQRRNQKIVEESPAPSVSAELRARMGDAALAVARAVGYANAGTVEFLLTDAGDFFFVEMNTRLQVEHPVTEAVTGRDLVADQLRIAAGEPLGFGQSAVRWSGHAIEARLYAEDPDAGFLPAAGRVLRLRWPDGVRVDTGIREGDTVSDRYDPLLAKLIARGRTRDEALAAPAGGARRDAGARRAHQPALPALAARPAGRARRPGPDRYPRGARAASGATSRRRGVGLPRPARSSGRSPRTPGVAAGAERLPRWCGCDSEMRNAASRCARPAWRSRSTGGTAHVDVEGQSLELSLAPPPSIEEAVRHAAAHAGGTAALTAPMPGRVIAVRAAEGAAVVAHQAIVVIEAMKMEHAVVTPLAGTVTRVAVTVGQQVQRGDLLAEVSA